MKKAILGKKIGMTQVFLDDGRVAPVTVVLAGPCTVVQKKTVEAAIYESCSGRFSVRLTETREETEEQTKPAISRKPPTRVLREFRLDDISSIEVGQKLTVESFAAGDRVDVSGVSKGHGYSGVVQRWNQHTGPMSTVPSTIAA